MSNGHRRKVGRVEYFRLGDWLVHPSRNMLEREGSGVRIEPRAMETLELLACFHGEVVSSQRILAECWAQTDVGDNPVHKAIAQLRRALGDSAKAPRYIETIPRRGYRLVASPVFPEGFRGMAAQVPLAWARGSPFVGLAAFDRHHSQVFFGRRKATADVLSALEAQVRNSSALVLVVGASGCGKTSLLSAGVLPRLVGEAGPGGRPWLPIRVDAGAVPARSLAWLLAEAVVAQSDLFHHGERDALERTLLDDPEAGAKWLVRRTASHRHGTPGHQGPLRVALAIDHFERLLWMSPARDGSAWEQLVVALCRSGSWAVLAACRSDQYARLARFPALLSLKSPAGHVDLAPPGPGELAEIIREPARAAGLEYETDPVDGRLDDVLRDAARGHPGSLPLLQHALQRLYELRSREGVLTFSAYRQIGGLAGALTQQADAALSQLEPSAVEALPALLGRIVEIDEDGELTGCRHVRWRDLESLPERRLVDVLVRYRLLLLRLEGGERMVVAAHETFLRAWSPSLEWIHANAAALRLGARLTAGARRWNSDGRPIDQLLPPSALLNDAHALMRDHPDRLDAVAQQWIVHSWTAAIRKRNLRRLALAGGLVLALASLGLGLVAEGARREAAAQRDRATGLIEFMVEDLSEKLQPLGRLDLMDGIGERVLQDVRAAGRRGDPDTGHHHARVLLRFASTRVSQGQAGSARHYVEEALALSRRLAHQHPGEPARLIVHGEAWFWDGYLSLLDGNPDAAQVAWEAYRELARQAIALDPHEPDYAVELSYALNSLGTLARRRGANREALALFDSSIRYKRLALQQRPDETRWLADLADSVSWSAGTLDRLGQTREAIAAYETALETMVSARRQSPQDALWVYRQALLLGHRGDAHRTLQNLGRAQASYGEAIGMLQTVLESEPDNNAVARDLAALLIRAAQTDLDLSHHDDARRHVGEAGALIAALDAQNLELPAMPRLRAQWGLTRATILRDAGEPAAAGRMASRHLRDIEAVATRPGPAVEDVVAWVELALLHHTLSPDTARAPPGALDGLERARLVVLSRIGAGEDRRLLEAWAALAQPLGRPEEHACALLARHLLASGGPPPACWPGLTDEWTRSR